MMDAMTVESSQVTDKPAPVTDAESGVSARTAGKERPAGWLKVGAVAAASALVGGLAAAWYYRKTLARMQEAETRAPETDSSSFEG
jgi:hypothetical protein